MLVSRLLYTIQHDTIKPAQLGIGRAVKLLLLLLPMVEAVATMAVLVVVLMAEALKLPCVNCKTIVCGIVGLVQFSPPVMMTLSRGAAAEKK